ncbi:MAG: phosphotransferase [Pseudomonadota bacterium]
MGVITKMLYRGEDLQLAPYRNLFLDMEENIHIHYRDLRIELSRIEFEEFVHTFVLQSKELLTIIDKKNYQDGKLPNSNQEDTRIWTESRLNHPVKYHSKRISIEECTDGYHVHLRNYKFLLNKEDFRAFYKAICAIDMDSAYASTRKDIIQLFKDNDLDFVVTRQDDKQNISYIQVANYHLSKIQSICEKIGLTQEIINQVCHIKNDHLTLLVSIVPGQEMPKLKKILSADSSSLLVTYLVNNKGLNINVLNHIKCQVLNLFNYAKKCATSVSARPIDVDLNFLSWNYQLVKNKVVFPFRISTEKLDLDKISLFYQDWSNFLKENELSFIKPDKIVFDFDQQTETRHKIYTDLIENLASVEEVAKIYVMGSLIRKNMGLYSSPFVHSEWAKLGSDVDILIEMESDNSCVPDNWLYINQSQSNSCDIYHLNQLSIMDRFGFQAEFPHIQFFHHLIDAFVFFPEKSDLAKKDAFLKKFNAKLFYSNNKNDKLDIQFNREEEIADPWAEVTYETTPENKQETEQKNRPEVKKKITKEAEQLLEIKSNLENEYAFTIQDLSKMMAATENNLYQFNHLNQPYILKCYKVSGNYSSKRLMEHAEYEQILIECLSASHVKTAKLIKNTQGKGVICIGKYPAILYTFVPGRIFKYPDPIYPIKEATEALAIFHDEQLSKPLLSTKALTQAFSFDDVFDIWHPVFYRFMDESSSDKELLSAFNKLENIYQKHKKLYKQITENPHILNLHNHGDVTPRNFVITDGYAVLIDFQNAFYGPRLLDVVDGAYEFSFGGKSPGRDDFNRFGQFIDKYQSYSPFSKTELALLDDTIKVCGVIKFIKEVRMIKGSAKQNNLRRLRALSVSQFLITEYLT